jgi:putative ABC transport system permease protein
VTQTLTVFLGAIAGISLLVGGIGIMNIMLVSVTERTKEIGLRKAVGATKNQILTQFLIETVTLSLLGGILGILLGVGIALAFSVSGLISSVITADSILLAFTFALAIGVFFGLYPASRAANLHPMVALRYE